MPFETACTRHECARLALIAAPLHNLCACILVSPSSVEAARGEEAAGLPISKLFFFASLRLIVEWHCSQAHERNLWVGNSGRTSCARKRTDATIHKTPNTKLLPPLTTVTQSPLEPSSTFCPLLLSAAKACIRLIRRWAPVACLSVRASAAVSSRHM